MSELAKALASEVRVHEADPDSAKALVLKTWLLSYRDSSFARHIRSGIYYKHHHDLAEAAFNRSKILVVSPADCDDQYLAWCAFERQPVILHYIFTKPDYRHMGFASLLLAELPADLVTTHVTLDGYRLLLKSGKKAVCDPYLFLGAIHGHHQDRDA